MIPNVDVVIATYTRISVVVGVNVSIWMSRVRRVRSKRGVENAEIGFYMNGCCLGIKFGKLIYRFEHFVRK